MLSRISHVDELLLFSAVTREIRNNEVLVLAFENSEDEGLLATHDSNSYGGRKRLLRKSMRMFPCTRISTKWSWKATMMSKQTEWRMFWWAKASLLFDSFVCFPPQILAGEVMAFFMRSEGAQEKTIVTADCCYFNPLLRRIIRFLGTFSEEELTVNLLGWGSGHLGNWRKYSCSL